MNKNFLRWAIPVMAVVFAACNKNDFQKQPVVKPAQGVYVLNEGGFGRNNAGLGYYDFTEKTYGDLFESKNNIKLGDVANDAIIYGGKTYIVINNSGLLMVANAATGKYIDSIEIKKPNAQGKSVSTQPRNVVAYNGKVYVSTWLDGIKVIDTLSLKISQTIGVRAGAEGMAVKNNNLYAVVGGSWKGEYDSVISVVNLSTNIVTNNITVGYNPVGKIYLDNADNAYVYLYGKYDASYKLSGSALVKLNLQTEIVTKKVDGVLGKISLFDNKIYAIGGDGGFKEVKVFNSSDLSIASTNFITDGTSFVQPYGINIDETNGDVYVTDAKDYQTSGSVYAFDKTGKKKFSFATTGGIMPNVVLFKR